MVKKKARAPCPSISRNGTLTQIHNQRPWRSGLEEYMSQTESEDPAFVANLLGSANAIRRVSKLPASDDLADAAILVAADIVVRIVPPDVFSDAAQSPEISRKVGAFLCFVVSSILISMKQEGYPVPQNEVLVAAFLGIYQMHSRDTISRLLVDGVRRYTSILRATATDPNALDYVNSVNKTVQHYVVAEDTFVAERLADLYDAVAEVETAEKE